ncbi:3-keto-disaccharide hydrolase [Formosa sp. 4Alg 33]|uniref:3-keto-disaccharide hydrolase n=1 Tax=Formosa sp. 4Alg 33 TaxID=3382189 RepID=UPI003D9C34A6
MKNLVKKSSFLFLLATSFASLVGCGDGTPKDNVLTDAEKSDGWKLLFDGTSTDGWRGYQSDEMPASWKVIDGTLMTEGAGSEKLGDIVTTEKYENFDLKLEWKLEPEGNSGVLYHINEDPSLAATYYSGPEYQIIDDLGFPGGVTPYNSTGADYAMTPADESQKVLNPINTWNTTRIVFDHGKVTHYLNGKKIVEFTSGDAAWNENIQKRKWKNYPAYGKSKTGFIGLQDHGSKIWFKNIKLKEL